MREKGFLNMGKFDLHAFAEELNAKAQSYRIGELQKLRVKLHGLKRRPGRDIFTPKTTFDNYAFHHGGRSELQFNIGTSDTGGKMLRYGVAFSFETSQSLPTIDPLRPKVRLFNKFLQLYPDLYSERRERTAMRMEMRHSRDGRWSEKSRPQPIPPEWVAKGEFVFLGCHSSVQKVGCDRVLTVMDRLLPLYKYVESKGRLEPDPRFLQTEPRLKKLKFSQR